MSDFEFYVESPKQGYVDRDVEEGDLFVPVVKDFATTSNWYKYEVLAGIVDSLLVHLPKDFNPFAAESMLFISHSSGKVEVYTKRLEMIYNAISTRAIEKGESVTRKDIKFPVSLDLGVSIPADVGIIFVSTLRWRRGIFIDHSPLWVPDLPRIYDLNSVLADFHGRLIFEDEIVPTPDDYKELIRNRWFPFYAIPGRLLHELIIHARTSFKDFDTSSFVDEVYTFVLDYCNDGIIDNWKLRTPFKDHSEDLIEGIEKFKTEDWRFCIQTLYPKIEGVMRSNAKSMGRLRKGMSSSYLIDTALEEDLDNYLSTLHALEFSTYLREVYFRNFNNRSLKVVLSRNSLAHGVVDPVEYNKQNAVITVLTLDHLFNAFERDLQGFQEYQE